MSHFLTKSCLLFSCLFFMASTTPAAALVLRDKESGYSLELPDGQWQKSSSGETLPVAAIAAAMLGINDTGAFRQQGARFIDAKDGLSKAYAIAIVPAKALAADPLAELTSPGGAAARNRLKKQMEDTMAAQGVSLLDLQFLDDGFCANTRAHDPTMPKGYLMYQRVCFRGVGGNVFVYTGVYAGKNNEEFDKDFQRRIDGFTISN